MVQGGKVRDIRITDLVMVRRESYFVPVTVSQVQVPCQGFVDYYLGM